MIKLNINKLFLVFLLFLPLQDTLRMILHLPVFFLLIYLFMSCAFLYILINEDFLKKNIKILNFLTVIFLLYILEMLISGIINYPYVIERNMALQYYVTRYKPFWDEPLASFIFAGIIRPFIYFSFSLFLIKFLNNENKIRYLIKSLILLAFTSSLYAIYQFFAYKFGLPFGSIFSGHNGELIEAMGIRRCEGFFYEPGPHAAYLSPVFCYCVWQFKNSINPILKKKTLITVTLVILSAMLLTLSPIGILTPPIVALFFFIDKFRKLSLKNKIIFSFLCIVLLSIFYLALDNLKIGNKSMHIQEYIAMRIYNTFNNNSILTGDSRVIRSEFGIKLFKDHKILGVGPGNDGYFFSKYAPFAVGLMGDKNVVLNNHLKILVDSGILGAIFYVIILFIPYYLYYKYNKLIRYNQFIYYTHLAGLYSIMIYLILEFNAGPYFFQPLFWIVYSLTIATTQIQSNYVIEKRIINNVN